MRIHLLGNLRRDAMYASKSGSLEMEGELTVKELFGRLGLESKNCIVIANGRILEEDAKLEGVQEIFIANKVYGG
ncbi:MAG: hypothetical protein ABIM30_03275 [candidate division WOR-3 bacterium]